MQRQGHIIISVLCVQHARLPRPHLDGAAEELLAGQRFDRQLRLAVARERRIRPALGLPSARHRHLDLCASTPQWNEEGWSLGEMPLHGPLEARISTHNIIKTTGAGYHLAGGVQSLDRQKL